MKFVIFPDLAVNDKPIVWAVDQTKSGIKVYFAENYNNCTQEQAEKAFELFNKHTNKTKINYDKAEKAFKNYTTFVMSHRPREFRVADASPAQQLQHLKSLKNLAGLLEETGDKQTTLGNKKIKHLVASENRSKSTRIKHKRKELNKSQVSNLKRRSVAIKTEEDKLDLQLQSSGEMFTRKKHGNTDSISSKKPESKKNKKPNRKKANNPSIKLDILIAPNTSDYGATLACKDLQTQTYRDFKYLRSIDTFSTMSQTSMAHELNTERNKLVPKLEDIFTILNDDVYQETVYDEKEQEKVRKYLVAAIRDLFGDAKIGKVAKTQKLDVLFNKNKDLKLTLPKKDRNKKELGNLPLTFKDNVKNYPEVCKKIQGAIADMQTILQECNDIAIKYENELGALRNSNTSQIDDFYSCQSLVKPITDTLTTQLKPPSKRDKLPGFFKSSSAVFAMDYIIANTIKQLRFKNYPRELIPLLATDKHTDFYLCKDWCDGLKEKLSQCQNALLAKIEKTEASEKLTEGTIKSLADSIVDTIATYIDTQMQPLKLQLEKEKEAEVEEINPATKSI